MMATNSSRPATFYSPALDGIRALAALLIVYYHAKPPSFSGGFFAVDVFFVLSGYLITGLLLAEYRREGSINYRAFMRRRLNRLLPALWVFLVVYLLLSPFFLSLAVFEKHLRDALLSAFYVVNYASTFGTGVSVLGHIWSLAVEMQFYLLWPLVLLVLLKLPRRMLLAVLCGLFVAATAWRWWGTANLDGVWRFYPRTDMRASGLLLGACLAVWQKRIHPYWAVLGFLLLAFAMTFYSTHWQPTARYGFTVAEVGAALVVLSQPAWLGNRLLVWIGSLSYGLYLWHYLFMQVLRQFDLPWQVVLGVGGSLGLLAAFVSYHLLEKHFYQRRAGPPTL